MKTLDGEVLTLVRSDGLQGEGRLRFSKKTLNRLCELFERGARGDLNCFNQWLELAGPFFSVEASLINRNSEFFIGFAEHVRKVLESCPDSWFEAGEILVTKASWFARDLEATSRASLREAATAIRAVLEKRRAKTARRNDRPEAIATEIIYLLHVGDREAYIERRSEFYRAIEGSDSAQWLLETHLRETWEALLLAVVDERREMFETVLDHLLDVSLTLGASPVLEEKLIFLLKMLSRFSVTRRKGESIRTFDDWLRACTVRLSTFFHTEPFKNFVIQRYRELEAIEDSLWMDLVNYVIARRLELFESLLSIVLELSFVREKIFSHDECRIEKTSGTSHRFATPVGALPSLLLLMPRQNGEWEKRVCRILDGFYNRARVCPVFEKALKRAFRNLYFRATDSSSIRMLAMNEVLEKLGHRIGTDEAVREMVSKVRLALGIPYNEYEKLLRNMRKRLPAVKEQPEKIRYPWVELVLEKAVELEFVALDRSEEMACVFQAFRTEREKVDALLTSTRKKLEPMIDSVSKVLRASVERAALDVEKRDMLATALRSMELSVFEHYLKGRDDEFGVRTTPAEGTAVGIFPASSSYSRPVICLFFNGNEMIAREGFRGRLMQAFISYEPDGKPLVHIYNRNQERLIPAVSFVTRKCIDTFKDSLYAVDGKFDIALVDFRLLEPVIIVSCRAFLDFSGRQIEAQTLMGSGEFDAAISILEEMLEEEQIPTGTHHLLGLCYKRRARENDLSSALLNFLEEFRRNPFSFEAASSIGIYYKQMGDFEQAIEWMEKSFRIQPNYVSNLLSLASTYLSRPLTGDSLERVMELAVAAYNICPEDSGVKEFMNQVRRYFEIDIELFARISSADTGILA